MRRFGHAVSLALAVSGSCFLGAAPGRAEIFVVSTQAIRVFADGADGDVAPIRSIEGSNTLLDQPRALALDLEHRELFVSEMDRVLVFSMDATGDVAPLRKLEGVATGLFGATGLAIDPVADELWVANIDGDALHVYPRTVDGDVAPSRSIAGAATGLAAPALVFLDLVHGEVFVSNIDFGPDPARITVHDLTASGDAAPLRTISGTTSQINNPRSVVVDLEHDELLVTEYDVGRVRAYARTANGDVAPLRTVTGGSTGLTKPYELVLTRDDEMLIAIDGSLTSRVVGHARSASGDATPTRWIEGSNTLLAFATGVVSDRAKECSSGRAVTGCLYRDGFEGGDVCLWSSAPGAPACP